MSGGELAGEAFHRALIDALHNAPKDVRDRVMASLAKGSFPWWVMVTSERAVFAEAAARFERA